MVIWQNRIFGLCIPLLLMTVCGQNALQQPDLITGQFQAGTDITVPTIKLNLIDYYSKTTAGLPKIPDDMVTIDTSGTGPWTIFLGFSEFLNGDLIETVAKSDNGQVTGFVQVPGSIEVATCDLTAQNCKSYAGIFTLAYRPDGGYVPKPDTPVSNFPPPAIAVSFTTALPTASIMLVNVIAGEISNDQAIFMSQVSNSNGDKITSPASNSPIAGTIWFQTK